MSQFKELQSIIDGMVQNLGIGNQLLAAKAVNYWPMIVGPKIAQNTNADHVKDGKLFVKTKSDAWRNELAFYKHNLIKRLNEKLGKEIITDIILL